MAKCIETGWISSEGRTDAFPKRPVAMKSGAWQRARSGSEGFREQISRQMSTKDSATVTDGKWSGLPLTELVCLPGMASHVRTARPPWI